MFQLLPSLTTVIAAYWIFITADVPPSIVWEDVVEIVTLFVELSVFFMECMLLVPTAVGKVIVIAPEVALAKTVSPPIVPGELEEFDPIV